MGWGQEREGEKNWFSIVLFPSAIPSASNMASQIHVNTSTACKQATLSFEAVFGMSHNAPPKVPGEVLRDIPKTAVKVAILTPTYKENKEGVIKSWRS